MFVIAPGTLVVSCQAAPGNPFHSAERMALMARAAEAGGAGAIRANGAEHIAAIRAATTLPIIGINKLGDPAGVFITPTFESAVGIVAAGADLVALDGTLRPRPNGTRLDQQIARIHAELGVPVMADVDSLEAGIAARDAGADLVASTLSGYTNGQIPTGPDVELVRQLAAKLDCPIVAEGRVRTPDDVRAVCEAGAYAVVVGHAITNPMDITARLVSAIPIA
ncbi:putative N-acetylmannosamine-6-phosphate 2-epimerase [Kribbella sandramycini]|uniref:N-acylglucosamine-6-phosphate 2-epimerase n=1 Tax=Kribbella sandramycini TaxID=60450 RepID=A0A7Y4P1C3_9ACTN|nr:putative N-acetylmannosamine-6-phosphate 2-epimerase [Kribbella sandramycini]MBB6565681.1 N-acylglucosamine-6-phosphate 2-epimerase [Kribbella sandramycini]NOL41944.1 putative N-acetylmannosamine-6-phosphate 2-epimerase [Kribbella sandramycini]